MHGKVSSNFTVHTSIFMEHDYCCVEKDGERAAEYEFGMIKWLYIISFGNHMRPVHPSFSYLLNYDSLAAGYISCVEWLEYIEVPRNALSERMFDIYRNGHDGISKFSTPSLRDAV